jgi:predicted enzyme related to lactoylglutathione lyase
MGNPVTHFEVVGKDASRLQQFYAEAFGWEMKLQIPGYAMAHTGSKEGIAGGVGAAMNGGSGHVTFYVQVDDVSIALRRVEELGGKTVMPSTKIPGGPTIGLFHDPEGHLIGLAVPASAR